MSNVVIGFGNIVESVGLANGSWLPSMPLSNLQTRQLGVVARSTDLSLASTTFDFTLPAKGKLTVAALANHNLPLDGRHRLIGGSDPTFATVNYDSGWQNVWPAVYHTMDLHWEDANWWDGRYTEAQRAGYTWTLTQILPSTPLVNYSPYWRWSFDAHNSTATYVQAGRLFLGSSWQPALNMTYGATLAWQDDSVVQAAISGAEFFDAKTPYRVATFRTEYMSEDDGMSFAFEINRTVGVTKEVLYIWNPADTLHSLRRQFLARLRSLSPLEFPQGFLNGNSISHMGWEVKELVP